jgi:hypothetical protein
MKTVGRINPTVSIPARKEQLLGLAVISLLILVVIVIIAIPVLIRVLGEATNRNPNRPDDEGDETSEGGPGSHSGPGRE